ncbi:hypothetical protein B4U79_13307 [Dinothrombium tinctorium]|uniref:Small ribosomal subunit protein uS4 N-terminal domain-containing protein n=1 Tax=Dinothrombium tinctorium TaxID=1965070 RepID=A0A443RGN3_9ACAR|nr:hypothetical protein B4U79_13307 [Dinothrombium tinctorium]
MVRKLKFHERKLLKKVDFINWENNIKEIAIMKRYNIDRQEYTKYNKLCRAIRDLGQRISALPIESFRNNLSNLLIEKLYAIGILKTKRLKKCNQVTVKSFCRRRIAVFMIQSGMFNGPISTAVKYVKHGHVRIGPNIVRDPAFLVTRNQEDFITWTDKFKQKIETYNDERDDYIE